MPTGTEHRLRRRPLLGALAAIACAPAWAGPASTARLLAAWQQGAEQHVGVLQAHAGRVHAAAQVVVPTRAHGLLLEPGGSVLAVARRPGDWLLRWHPGDGRTQWHWTGDDRRFNGHVVTASHPGTLWTTETDLESAQGLVGVRDAASLDKRAEWPTHGMDPHQLLALPQAVGPWPAGTLLVANGGISTLPETGRSKRQLERMDASLVALHPRTGALLGQWRLRDRFLSIRHLAWDGHGRRLGIALQAEHPEAAARAAAPVLAVWDGGALQTATQQPALQGYGGDICAHPGGGFVVSCPRADALAVFTADARFVRTHALAQACPLSAAGGGWWSGGRGAALQADASALQALALPAEDAGALVLDNHWLAWPRAGAAPERAHSHSMVAGGLLETS